MQPQVNLAQLQHQPQPTGGKKIVGGRVGQRLLDKLPLGLGGDRVGRTRQLAKRILQVVGIAGQQHSVDKDHIHGGAATVPGKPLQVVVVGHLPARRMLAVRNLGRGVSAYETKINERRCSAKASAALLIHSCPAHTMVVVALHHQPRHLQAAVRVDGLKGLLEAGVVFRGHASRVKVVWWQGTGRKEELVRGSAVTLWRCLVSCHCITAKSKDGLSINALGHLRQTRVRCKRKMRVFSIVL